MQKMTEGLTEKARDRIICTLYAEGRSHQSIAKLFDISRSEVLHIVAYYCVTVIVNDKPVVLPSKEVLGIDVKHYAGLTGVDMSYNAAVHGPRVEEQFVLQVDNANGTSRIIGDEDKITLHKGMVFTAYGASDYA